MTDSRRSPNVLTIPAGAPFLRTLVDGLLDGEVVPGFAPRHDPLALADATIFLPTRRAARALRDAFLDALDGRAALLPRIAPLGDVEEDASLADAPDDLDAELPPAVGPLERRLTLARMVMRFAETLDRSALSLDSRDGPLIPATAAEAIHLAGDLEALVEAVETEEVDLSSLDTLVGGEHDTFWELTSAFLKIALRAWPDHVEGLGRMDPSRRRRLQIDAAAARVAAGDAPVVAAGSTGSVPATRRLLAAIAHAPRGAVVLPGFDRDALDDASYARLLDEEPGSYGHPQRGLALLVRALGARRDEVRAFGPVPPFLAARARLVADAMRPAATTDMWSYTEGSRPHGPDALDGVASVAAEHPRGEAEAIAVALRETLERPGATAALVTPDRDLAIRVGVELERWGVAVDDSAGAPLKDTDAGALLRLLAEAGLDPSPSSLHALLRHPRGAAWAAEACGPRAADALAVLGFRSPALDPGFAALDAAPAPDPARRPSSIEARFDGADREAARRLLNRLRDALQPLTPLQTMAEAPLDRLADALTCSYTFIVGERSDEASEHILGFLEELREAAAHADPVPPRAASGVLVALMAGRVVRPAGRRHPRLQILGPLEARMIQADRVVLGGLNEAVWPPAPQADPWINRPLRAQLGLPPPERRIGLSAHDFAQGLGAREVILTRAAKAGGAPTIASRWLERIAAVADPAALAAAEARGRRFAALADALDDAPRDAAPQPPAPRPSRDLRPTRMSVTAVETWLRDPYSIYARMILRLDELGPIAPPPGPRELGEAIHAALQRFVEERIDPAGPAARDALLGFGRDAFGPLLARDEIRVLWWPRFERAADWMLGFERDRAPHLAAAHVEQKGETRFTTSAGREFALTARADRVDAMADGTYAILDYKTGAAATVKQALAGFAPQLPLEAAILRAGGFSLAPGGGDVGGLTLLRLTGRDPAGEITDIRDKAETLDAVADRALARFKAVVERFENEEMPYLSLSHPRFVARPEGPYAHLARVKEWSATGGAPEGDGGDA